MSLVPEIRSDVDQRDSSLERGRRTLRLAVYGAVALIAITIFLPLSVRFRIYYIHPDGPIWLLACQTMWMGAVVYFAGFPRTVRHRVLFTLLNLALAGVATLWWTRTWEYTLTRFLELLLRLSVPLLWGFAVIGFPVVVPWVVRYSRTRKPLPMARWWFSTCLFLAMAESLCAYRLWMEDRMMLPGRLPDPPADEIHIVALEARRCTDILFPGKSIQSPKWQSGGCSKCIRIAG